MPMTDPKRPAPTPASSECDRDDEPAGDLLFDPEAADRNKLHKDDPSIATDAPFEENSATDGEGQ